MAFHKRPPRGYYNYQYPLPHNFEYRGQLTGEGSAQNATILTLFRASEACTDVENIEVNPRHANFAEETGPTIHMGSIIPKVTINMKLALSKEAEVTDNIRRMMVKWAPIYTAFLPSLDAEDDKTGNDIETLIELQHDTGNKDTYPLFNGTKVTSGNNHPLSTVTDADEAFADYGLSTSAVLEYITFDTDTFYDAMQYYTNGGMLRKVMGKWQTTTVTRENEYNYYSNNYTYPMVKRGNPYTFCGILLWVPPVAQAQQYNFIADTTANLAHVNFGLTVRYDEWNPLFQQAQI